MSTEKEKTNGKGAEPEASTEERKPRYDWEDPSVPIGDGPPMPNWPLVPLCIAWGLCITFLAVMSI